MPTLPLQQLEISSLIPLDSTREFRVNNGPRASLPRYIKPLRRFELVWKGLTTSERILVERFFAETVQTIDSFEFTHPYGYTVINATNTTPIVITTQYKHGFLHCDWVTVSGVEGNTNANGTFQIINVTDTSFTLLDSVGNGVFSDPNNDAIAQLYFKKVRLSTQNGTINIFEKIYGPNKNNHGVFFIKCIVEELL